MSFKKIIHSNIGAAIINMLVALLVFMLSRVAFFLVNWSTFAPYMSWTLFWHMVHGALVFDTSALLYINALYILLTLLPLHLKEFPTFHQILKWIFVVTNSIGVASNLIDSVYFQYTGRRSTITVFSEFSNEGNITSIILTEFLNHWYLVLVFALLVFLLWKCFMKPRVEIFNCGWKYYTTQLVSLLIVAPLAIVGIRGSVTAGTRPITISNANEFVNRPVEATVVLNTPILNNTQHRQESLRHASLHDYSTDEQHLSANNNAKTRFYQSGQEERGYLNHGKHGQGIRWQPQPYT
jgi:hypothetical protein